MKCIKCGINVNSMDHFFVPRGKLKMGIRYCIKCAREECIVTLV
jgi:hypothetical protein